MSDKTGAGGGRVVVVDEADGGAGGGVIRLSLGKLLVNLLHVVKRTINNTSLIPQQWGDDTRTPRMMRSGWTLDTA